MKNDFPRIYISPEIRRKMIEIAREFRKAPTKGEKILSEAEKKETPSPILGEGKGGG
jgi:hypothetical protein